MLGLTVLHFCPPAADTTVGGWVGSSSYGARLPAGPPPWWPHSLGLEVENLGNVLAVADLPAEVDVGVRVVAYGAGNGELEFRIAPDDPSGSALPLQERVRVHFVPVSDGDALGIAAVRVPLRGVRLEHPGLHWLVARLGDSTIRMPFVVRGPLG